MNRIKLNDILQLTNLENVKIRFNLMFGGDWNPIEIFKDKNEQRLLDGHYWNYESNHARWWQIIIIIMQRTIRRPTRSNRPRSSTPDFPTITITTAITTCTATTTTTILTRPICFMLRKMLANEGAFGAASFLGWPKNIINNNYSSNSNLQACTNSRNKQRAALQSKTTTTRITAELLEPKPPLQRKMVRMRNHETANRPTRTCWGSDCRTRNVKPSWLVCGWLNRRARSYSSSSCSSRCIAVAAAAAAKSSSKTVARQKNRSKSRTSPTTATTTTRAC